MHFEVTQVQNQGFVELATCHKKERIYWKSMPYSKVRLREPLRVFDEINGFLGQLPEDVQDELFAIYAKVKDLLDMGSDMAARPIQKHVKRIYELCPLTMFQRYAAFHLNLHIPEDVVSSAAATGPYDKTENTYLRPAYVNLAVLAFSIRLMIPIWGEFIDQTTGNDFKETEAVALFDLTNIRQWPEEEPAWDKLFKYIRHFGDADKALLSNLWRGLGSEEIPDSMMAKVIVRRLTIAPLTGPHSHNIVANVFRWIDNNSAPQERSARDRVVKKDPDKSPGDEDKDKLSIVESYKLKQRVSDGDVVLFQVASMNMEGLAKEVDPTIDMDILRICTSPKLLNDVGLVGEINPHQARLAQWVLADVFPAKAFSITDDTKSTSLIEDMHIYRLLAVTQALLWHWGYLDLALLMQVQSVTESDQHIPSLTRNTKSGARITPQYKEELNKLYPYFKPQRAKAKDPNPESAYINPVIIAINNVTVSIRSSDWMYRGPEELYKAAQVPDSARQMVPIPQSIKNTITELVIHLAKINA